MERAARATSANDAGPRGYAVVGAVLDEVAFWRCEDSANPDGAIAKALRPAMATVPGALTIMDRDHGSSAREPTGPRAREKHLAWLR